MTNAQTDITRVIGVVPDALHTDLLKRLADCLTAP